MNIHNLIDILEMASQKEEIAVAERRLLADAQQFDQLKATVNAGNAE